MKVNELPWDEYAQRILIYTPHYLEFNGCYSPGGRQRHIRDLALVIKQWGRDVVVVQKSTHNFETVCPDGIPVVGIKSELSAKGDLFFSYAVKKMGTHPNDVWLYASGENAWPFFVENSKAIQHGIWWDGPQSYYIRAIQKIRAMGMMRNTKSVLCVDTNFINWLRCQGQEGYRLTSKCVYIPNYVDLSCTTPTKRLPTDKLAIISARRFEEKRGTMMLIDAFAFLRDRNIDFEAHICTIGGVEQLTNRIKSAMLTDRVKVTEESMDSVLEKYQYFHVAVVPTLWSEGTSLAAVEALAAGLPVVCSPVGGLGNLIIPGFNGFIVNPDPMSIAKALQNFTTKNVWETMSSNCLRMRPCFGIDRWSNAVLEWLKK